MALSPSLHLPHRTTGTHTVIRLAEPKLDETNVQRVGADLTALIAAPAGPAELHLDLGAVAYLSSVALGTLVGLHTRAARAGRRLVLTNVQPFVREVIAVTRLDRVLEVRPTTDEGDRPAAAVAGS